MLVFDSSIWHAAGDNTSGKDRLALNQQFTRAYVKQQVDYVRALGGDIVEDSDDMALPLTLAKPIEIFVIDGKPDGRFRVAGGQWKRRARSMWIQGVELDGTLSPSGGPAASLKLILTVDH